MKEAITFIDRKLYGNAVSVAVVKVALHSIITQKSGTARFLPEL